MRNDILLTLAGMIGAGCAVAGWLVTRQRYERPGGLMDQTYDEGHDDGRRAGMADNPARYPSGILRLREQALPAAPALAAGQQTLALPETAGDHRVADSAADWLTATHEALSPDHIQDSAGRTELPAIAPPAGGHHHYDTGPLPAILQLGTEFDGSDRTFARWQLREWEHMRQFRELAIELDRELAWEKAA